MKYAYNTEGGGAEMTFEFDQFNKFIIQKSQSNCSMKLEFRDGCRLDGFQSSNKLGTQNPRKIALRYFWPAPHVPEV